MNTARNRVASGGNNATVMPPETAKAPVLETPRPSELNQRGRRPARNAPLAKAHDGDQPAPAQGVCALSALINRLGRPLALGMLDEQAAIAAVTNFTSRNGETPISAKLSRHLLRQSAEAFAGRRARDEARIRRVAWPMCEARKPSAMVLAKAADTAPETMREDEVLDLCREVALHATRRRRA